MQKKGLKLFGVFAHCVMLHVCPEWGPYKRWGAARHAKRSRSLVHAFSVLEHIAIFGSNYNPKCATCFKQQKSCNAEIENRNSGTTTQAVFRHVYASKCSNVFCGRNAFCPKSVPEVFQRRLGTLPTHSGPF